MMPATSGEAMLVPPTGNSVNFGGLFFGNTSSPVANPVNRSASAAMSGSDRTRPRRLPGAVASAFGTTPRW